MSRRSTVFVLAVFTTSMCVVSTAAASGLNTGAATPGVYGPTATVQNKSQAHWSAAMLTWTFDTPLHHKGGSSPYVAAANGPIDCSYEQTGTVWYLVPALGTNGSATSRSCAVPVGTSLFVPVLYAWADNLNYPGQPPLTETSTQLRAQAAGYLATSYSASFDGHNIVSMADLSSPYRKQSPTVHYRFPTDSFYNTYFGQTWPHGTKTPPPGAFGDGIYFMTKPLTAGTHTIHIAASGNGISEDVTYAVTAG